MTKGRLYRMIPNYGNMPYKYIYPAVTAVKILSQELTETMSYPSAESKREIDFLVKVIV